MAVLPLYLLIFLSGYDMFCRYCDRHVWVVRRWKGACGIWNLRAPPLFPQLYRPFAESEHLPEGKADVTPKSSTALEPRCFATAFTRAQWQGKDRKRSGALISPAVPAGAFTSHEQKSPPAKPKAAAPVPVATRVLVSYGGGGYRCRLPGRRGRAGKQNLKREPGGPGRWPGRGWSVTQ
jgi:hypothetical protein